MNNITKDVANQLCSIINLLPEEEKNKIPEEIIKSLKEKLSNEDLSITDIGEIRDENLLEDTKKYLAYIFLYYLSNEEEKVEFEKILKLNEERHQEFLRKKYDVSNIFKNSKEFEKKNEEEKVELIVVKGKTWWQKILEKLKELIARK